MFHAKKPLGGLAPLAQLNVHVSLSLLTFSYTQNPRRACAARVIVLGLSFRPSVCAFTSISPATHNKTAKKRFLQVQALLLK
jgi:hypothetical protein